MIENPKNLMSRLDGKVFLYLFLGGVAGTLYFEFCNIISTNFFDKSIQPVVIASKLALLIFGVELSLYPAGMTLHILTGILLYPLLYLFILKNLPNSTVFVTGLTLGLATWVLAQGVFSPMVGRPFMNGFSQFTWMSLVLHSTYAWVLAYAFGFLSRKLD